MPFEGTYYMDRWFLSVSKRKESNFHLYFTNFNIHYYWEECEILFILCTVWLSFVIIMTRLICLS